MGKAAPFFLNTSEAEARFYDIGKGVSGLRRHQMIGFKKRDCLGLFKAF